jgi:hypothetical protein
MYMRVEFEFPIPGMEYAEEADLRAEVLGITGDFQKRLRTDAEQKIVDEHKRAIFPFRSRHLQAESTGLI